jgi:prevent-host-death family protein
MGVGIRELKNRLSYYLDRVRKGEVIEVTDRGKPLARIVPAGIDEGLVRLIGEGKVSWSGRRFTPPARRVRQLPGSPSMSDAIAEDRR